ncbi:glycoside hydrolase family protein [Paenibacillus sp. KQZ6P-2]|uniref:Glycoside hydrolase family protein n=1 Tax=Paenibacillus mangrovi TaxID=2931978 RepID=A0A9X1WRM7_9BACL|nr:glycoside hydrolase family protein [Paenibacillus mangrovi]MCJ8012170.1 glycoside hydrolase family protein [Paenibacillus mangrovi]
MKDYWVWCGSVIRGEDGRYHMFASRWSKKLPFTPHWATNSEIVRAVADRPEGPYTFAEVVLPPRGSEYWDGRVTHNPTIHRVNGMYLLFYMGTTYEEDMPSPEHNPIQAGSTLDHPISAKARARQRIGLATSKSVFGPWERSDEPILSPMPGKWDSLMTTNPAPCIHPDGSVLLIYKAVGSQHDLLRLGVAKAPHYKGPYERLCEEPIFRFDETNDHIEDGYVWWSQEARRYEMIMKDMNGGICGEKHAGIHAYSEDGAVWHIFEEPLAYSRKVRWDNGSETIQGNLERPQLLTQDGRPTHLFAATSNSPEGFAKATDTWNMVIPLKE